MRARDAPPGAQEGRLDAMSGNSKMPKDRCPAPVEKFIRMEANLCTREQKLKEIFNIDLATAPENVVHAADSRMSRWRKHPMFDQIWKDELRSQDYEDYSTARKVLRKGMKQQEDGWLAMNSAINVIANGNRRLFADEQNAVTVRIEGMPELGVPGEE